MKNKWTNIIYAYKVRERERVKFLRNLFTHQCRAKVLKRKKKVLSHENPSNYFQKCSSVQVFFNGKRYLTYVGKKKKKGASIKEYIIQE
jgi:hypothetical protein